MLARVKRQTDSSDCNRSLSLLRMRLAVSRRQLTSLFAFKCAAIGTRTIGEIESRFAAGTTSKISKISVLDLWQWHCSRPFHSATFARLACIYPALVEELNIVMSMPLSVCLSLRARISGTTFSNFKKFYVPDSFLFWWQRDTLCSSDFVDDVLFARNGQDRIGAAKRRYDTRILYYCCLTCAWKPA